MGQAQSKSQDANISHARKLQIFKILNTCNVTSGVDKQAVSYLSLLIQSVEFSAKSNASRRPLGRVREVSNHARLEGHARRPESEGRVKSVIKCIIRALLTINALLFTALL